MVFEVQGRSGQMPDFVAKTEAFDSSVIAMEVRGVLRRWGIGKVQKVREIHPGRVFEILAVDGRSYILKAMGSAGDETPRRLDFEAEVLSHIAKCDVPVALPLRTVGDGALGAGLKSQVYTLSPKLPRMEWGQRNEKEIQQLCRKVGAAIARLHRALSSFPGDVAQEKTRRYSVGEQVFGSSIPAIEDRAGGHNRKQILQIIRNMGEEMQNTLRDLPEQMIHGDCHAGNILMDHGEVTGFVDWDHLSLGPRIYDLAYLIIHMIKTAHHNEKDVQRWLRRFPLVLRAYNRRSKLSPKERKAFFYMMMAAPLVCAEFHLLHEISGKADQELEFFIWLVGRKSEIQARWP